MKTSMSPERMRALMKYQNSGAIAPDVATVPMREPLKGQSASAVSSIGNAGWVESPATPLRYYDDKPACIGQPIFPSMKADVIDAVESFAVLVLFFGVLIVGLFWDLI